MALQLSVVHTGRGDEIDEGGNPGVVRVFDMRA
jgi:hypothetical protein